jgi:hypothetical protein
VPWEGRKRGTKMRKFNCIGRSLLILALIFVGVVSSQERWELIATTKTGSNLYIDTESIVMLSSGRYLIWERSYPVGTERESFMEQELKNVLDAAKFAYVMSRTEIDCSMMKYRIHSTVYYTDDGKIMRSVSEPSKWHDSPPGSVGEKVSKRVCEKGYDAKEF